MRRIVFMLAVFIAAPAAAQIQSRPTDAPIVTADNDLLSLGEIENIPIVDVPVF